MIQAEIGSNILSLLDSGGDLTEVNNGDANKIEELSVKTIAAIDRINKPIAELAAQQSPEGSLTTGLSTSQLVTMYRNSRQLPYELRRHSVGRKIAFTRNGHIILTPPLAAPGDEMHFVAFAETPFVLRYIDNQEPNIGKYCLVGDCEFYDAQEELDKLSEFKKLAIV